MLVTTKAILLHHIRYSDNSLIARFYTRDHGRLSVMVKGVSSKKGRVRFNYFQPLNTFNLEIYYRASRELHNLREMNLIHVPRKIPGDIFRSSIALFISEILDDIIREEEADKLLFDFIESSAVALDELTSGVSNFHLWFLVALSDYVGIGPEYTPMEHCYFDLQNGMFTPGQPMHPDYLGPAGATILNRLIMMSVEEIGSLKLTGEERTALLSRLTDYYSYHLPGIRQIRSLQVLKDIFI